MLMISDDPKLSDIKAKLTVLTFIANMLTFLQ